MLIATALAPVGLAGKASAIVQPPSSGPGAAPTPMRVSSTRSAEIGVKPVDAVVVAPATTDGASRPKHGVRGANQFDGNPRARRISSPVIETEPESPDTTTTLPSSGVIRPPMSPRPLRWL